MQPVSPLEYYHLFILGGLLAILLVALINRFTFPRLGRERVETLGQSVSVLVPARNEETTIGPCVRSLLQQTYQPLEIIVLNDGSTDRTSKVLSDVLQEIPSDRTPTKTSIRVVDGLPLRDGWLGKNHACHRLSIEATGDLLIFVDADTEHEPGSIESLVGYLEKTDADFVSAVPRQLVPTFWEKVIVPMAPFLYFCYLPNRLIPRKNHPNLSAANGQIIAVTREAYRSIGGHNAIRQSVVDDVDLARRAKGKNLKVDLVRADRTARCRMYRSLPEIVAGFSKNLFPGFGESTLLLAFFLMHLLLFYVLPPLFLLWGIIDGSSTSSPEFLLPVLQIAVGIALRALSASAFGMNPLQGILQPISALGVVAIGANSFRLYRFGSGGEWKGRRIVRSR